MRTTDVSDALFRFGSKVRVLGAVKSALLPKAATTVAAQQILAVTN